MRDSVSISLPQDLKKRLDRLAKKRGCNRSDVVRDALEHHLDMEAFREIRGKLRREAEKRGIFTDEDVFKIVS